MKPVVTITFIFYFGFAFSQNRITHYEYWFNTNYQARVHTNITPAVQVQFQGAFSTATLSDGLHQLNLHFGDDSGRYSTTLSRYFYRRTPANVATARVDSYQYWVDDQMGAAVTETVAPSGVFTLNAAIDVATLPPGLHLFHIRFRDNTRLWSMPVSHFFYKQPFSVGTGQNGVAAFQYWFDNGFDLAVTENLSGLEQVNFSKAISAALPQGGLHILHTRFKDALGQYSSVQSKMVYINPLSSNAATNGLTRMQYWFDDNVQLRQEKSYGGEQLLVIDENLGTSQLQEGIHRLNLRIGDTTGHWSTTLSSFFYKFDNGIITNNMITGYRYWFNNQTPAEMVEHTVPNQQVFTLNTEIDLGCLTGGVNRIHLQFRDKRQLWSTGITDTITVQPPAGNIYRFTGNGNWSNPANWQNNYMPSPDVPFCKEVIIDHAAGGACILDVPVTILKNSKITVLPGKHLVVSQNLRINIK